MTYTDSMLDAGAHQHSIGVWLRRRSDEAKAEVLVITGRLADLAEASVAEATNALAHRPRRRRVRRMIDDLAALIDRTNQVITQARSRVDGVQPDGTTRLELLPSGPMPLAGDDNEPGLPGRLPAPSHDLTSTPDPLRWNQPQGL